MSENSEIYTWFGLPIYECQVDPKPVFKDRMLKFCEKYYEENKHLKQENGALTGDTHGYTVNVCKTSTDFYYLTHTIGVHASRYLEQLGLDTSKVNINIIKSWPVCCETGSFINRHKHTGSHLSAVYYLQKETDTGQLRFYREQDHIISLPIFSHDFLKTTSFSNTFVDYNLGSNSLIIFPSSVEHEVLPYQGSSMRYSVSIDMIITLKPETSNVENLCTDPSTWVTVPFV